MPCANDPTPSPSSAPLKTLLRGARGMCPRCGEAPIFQRWHVVHETCAVCGCQFKRREGDCWGFMYVTMAILIGFFLIWMIFFPPTSRLVGFIVLVVLVPLALLATLPIRKGIALALDVLVDPHAD